ncbi:hypothetical protein [Mucilaginibacter sp. KACC 22063]|uniref:hypothetical protein n=1 Tax=Mucilaginibacter sp. KACC 22063 TaxID=3025666 RepID=UPI002366F5EF|nr:hypothetical protein [Mucilaginibacter sp. KACC 22063]WDF57182.1 hypothetical protein PQ461_08960 [Mucilaginibacter sp. KACC 22063]
MKTTVIESGKNNKVENKSANSVTAKTNNLPVSTAFNTSAKQDEVKKDEPIKAETKLPPVNDQNAPKVELAKEDEQKAQLQSQAEPTKAEVKAAIKPILNLEGTLKWIEEMHRKSNQRNKLQDTIKNLESFEVELRDEADTTDTNYYTGCVLTIEDDNRRKFETKNPTIIWAVAQMVNSMCVDKLAEIEASIVLPQ